MHTNIQHMHAQEPTLALSNGEPSVCKQPVILVLLPPYFLTSVVTHMLPDVSMQNTTIDSSALPPAAAAWSPT